MNAISIVEKIGHVLASPITTITEIVKDWATEPLKDKEHNRIIEAEDAATDRVIRENTAVIRTESELKINEAKQATELKIKEETEIIRITKEIEEMQKDKQLERMKSTMDALLVYKEKFLQLNISAIASIGKMELSLRNEVHEFILDKTRKYKELEKDGFKDAEERIQSIESKFSNNDNAKNIFYAKVDLSLSHTIKIAADFIDELKQDIKWLNENIDTITKKGHEAIEGHFGRQIDVLVNETKKIEDNKPKPIN